MKIYADQAATTKLSATAKEAMLPYFTQIYGNPSSLHTEGQLAKEALEASRAEIARCLGADASEIIFTSGGSESDNQALLTVAEIGERKAKKHLISTAFEHHAVLHTLKKLEKRGFEITLLDVHRNGVVTAEDVREAIRPDTVAVSVMYANNEIGTVMPISEIGAVCRSAGVIFHTDAVQAVGHLPIDVKAQHIDMLSLSAHKFHGPRGVGALFVRRGIPVSVLIEGGAQEHSRRAGTENLPGIVGMAAALSESCHDLNEHITYVSALRDRLIEALSGIPHSTLNGDPEKRLPGLVNFCFEGIEGESLLLMLNEKGIAASSGSACTVGSLDPSHVLLAIALPHEVANGSLRLSVDATNTMEEIEYIAEVVPRVVSYLRGISPVWEAIENGIRPHLI